MWAPFWASFSRDDFVAHKTKAHCSMTDVNAGVTSLWEKRGNDAADAFAKKGGLMHGAQACDFFLWQGLKALCREAAQWAGHVHAWVGDGEVGRDHDDVVEAWAALPSASPASSAALASRVHGPPSRWLGRVRRHRLCLQWPPAAVCSCGGA